MTYPHAPWARARLAAFALFLVLLLGATLESCLFFDLLTGLYTGTYIEYSACGLDATGCETLSEAHDACIADKGIGHAECRVIWDKFWDCVFCTTFPDLPPPNIAAAPPSDAVSAGTIQSPGGGPSAYATGALQILSGRADADPAAALSGRPFGDHSRVFAAADPLELFFSQYNTRISRTASGMTSVEEVVNFGRYPLGLVLNPAGSKVYWTDARLDGLRRANLDGTDKEDLLTGISGMTGLAFDASNGLVFWGNAGLRSIQQLDLATSAVSDVVDGLDGPTDLAFDPIGMRLYWIDNTLTGGRIRRLGPGGTAEDVVTGLTVPFGLAIDPSARKMYWSDASENRIRRAPLDGSAIEDVVTGLSAPGGLALDLVNAKMYWVNAGTIALQRANLDGSDVETLLLGSPMADLAVDASAGKIYWTGWLVGSLSRANLDGTAAEVLDQRHVMTGDLAIAHDLGKVYWTTRTSGRIQRADFDGSNIEEIGPFDPSPGAVAFNGADDRLYWIASGGVHRSDPDGSNPETILTGLVFISDLEIDEVNQKLYWINQQQIQRSDFDGSDVETFSTESSFIADLVVQSDSGFVYWTVPTSGTIRRARQDGAGGVESIDLSGAVAWHLAVSDVKLFWSLPFAGSVRRGELDGSNAVDVLINAEDITGLALASIAGPAPDVTAPVCRMESVAPGPPTTLTIFIQDNESGLAFLQVIEAQNANVGVPAFLFGDTSPLLVDAQKIDQTKRAIVELRVGDVAGNEVTCDPILQTLQAPVPARFALEGNYPNPFEHETRIPFGVPETGGVRLVVYDELGRQVAVLVDKTVQAGVHEATFSGAGLSSGNYTYRLETASGMLMRRMTIVR